MKAHAPLTMISKRVEEQLPVNVRGLYDETLTQVERLAGRQTAPQIALSPTQLITAIDII